MKLFMTHERRGVARKRLIFIKAEVDDINPSSISKVFSSATIKGTNQTLSQHPIVSDGEKRNTRREFPMLEITAEGKETKERNNEEILAIEAKLKQPVVLTNVPLNVVSEMMK